MSKTALIPIRAAYRDAYPARRRILIAEMSVRTSMADTVTTIRLMGLERGISTLIKRRMVRVVPMTISICGTPIRSEVAGLHWLKSTAVMRLTVTMTMKAVLMDMLTRSVIVLMIHAIQCTLVEIDIMLVARV